jgi:L-fuculose-phosphate aldolase
MLLERERDEIVGFGKKLITSNLTTGSGGNLSVFNRREGLVAIGPSGIDYFDVRPEDVVVINVDGEIVEGRCKPSSELNFHLSLYRKRSDINAVVHTHSVYATTIACLNREIPAVHYLVAFSGKKVPLAPYATFGTEALARNVSESIGDYNAVLLANHGLVTVGPDMSSAFSTAEEIEFVARVYYQTKCIGDPIILPEYQMARVIKKFETYGQKKE